MEDTPTGNALESVEDALANPRPLSLEELAGSLRDTLVDWVELTVQMLPNLVLALLVLALGYGLARAISTVAGRALDRVSSNRQVNYLLELALRLAILTGGAFAALAILRLDGVVTSLLAGVGVVGLALGFAFKDIAANFMSSVLLALSRPFQVGDLVETSGFFGEVERTDLRVTHLRTLDGRLVLIPNKDVYNAPVVNYTETADRRIEIPVGIGYDDDPREAKRVLEEALEALEVSASDRPVEVFCTGFGASSIDLVCRFWIRTRTAVTYQQAVSEGVIAIRETLADNGLHIPFPIRTLDFGAATVGGASPAEVLTPVFGEGRAESA